MSEELKITYSVLENDILQAKVVGLYAPGESTEIISDYFAKLTEAKTKKSIIDYTECTLKATAFEMYSRPKIAESLGIPKDVIVAVLIEDQSEFMDFYETVFVNAGYNVKLFTDKAGALEWLSFDNH